MKSCRMAMVVFIVNCRSVRLLYLLSNYNVAVRPYAAGFQSIYFECSSM